jgi:hypothetical protein
MAVGGLVLWKAIRRAGDGYEDTRGFHRGALPSVKIARPTLAQAPAPVRVSASPFPTVTGTGLSMSTSVANLLTSTTAPVTTVIKSPEAIPSPLYRRHRRSNNSRPPMPIASASPFEIQCAATRQRAGQTVDSTPPVDVSAKAIIKEILGQKSAR